MHVITDLL